VEEFFTEGNEENEGCPSSLHSNHLQIPNKDPPTSKLPQRRDPSFPPFPSVQKFFFEQENAEG